MLLTQLWYAVEFSANVTQQPQQLVLMGQSIVLYRNSQGQVVALADRCAHRGAALSLGWVEDNCLRCPYHGWKYDGQGDCVEIPANSPEAPIPQRAKVAGYTVTERYGFVWLWLGSGASDPALLPNLSQFADPQWYGCRDQFRWNAHYVRVIENNVDVSHPPFLHRRLGQRQNQNAQIQPLTLEPIGELGASVTLTAKMQKLKGPWQALVSQQGEMGSKRCHTFYLPNFTTLELSFGRFQMAFLMAHVPVSPDVTITKSLILRNFFKLAWLDPSINQFGQKLLREDELVVKTQSTPSFDLDRQDLLVPSDAMVLAYRKLYKKHRDAQMHTDSSTKISTKV
jgi:phenylpropionate dioxygenase-like ring-hydroxylating dioxygenase large terminal subunit